MCTVFGLGLIGHEEILPTTLCLVLATWDLWGKWSNLGSFCLAAMPFWGGVRQQRLYNRRYACVWRLEWNDDHHLGNILANCWLGSILV